VGVLLFVFVVGASLVGVKYWQISQMAGQGPPPEMPTFVGLAPVTSAVYRQTSTTIGTVLAPRSIVLSNEVAGTVARSNLPAGEVVEAGTVLLELDTSIETAQLEAAQAAARMAESRYLRTREARRNNALTELELEEAEGHWVQAQARVSELQAVIAKKTLTAPFRARVGLSDTHQGQYLPSGTEVTSLQSVDEFMYVDFTLPQHVAVSIQIGQQVSLVLDRESLQALVIAMDSRTDRLTRNRMVRARLDAAPSYLKPGDSVKALVEYGSGLSVMSVPVESIRRTPEGAQIFVAEADSSGQLRAHQRAIQVLRTMDTQALLQGGVRPGEMVVTTGSFKLLDGGLIQQADSEGAQSPSAVASAASSLPAAKEGTAEQQ
jgi:membrane fusion protein, multidrug efflux system